MAQALPPPTATNHCLSYGIFWDIENCPIPMQARADQAVQNIKQYISRQYESKVGDSSRATEPCAFVCACNAGLLDKHHVEALNRCGVDILHVNPTRNNHYFKVVADDKLKEAIQKFIEHHSDKSLIFIITGDVDFAPQIRTARRAGFEVILLYGNTCAGELRRGVESHSFFEIVNGVGGHQPDVSIGHNVQTLVNQMPVLPTAGKSADTSGTTTRSIQSVDVVPPFIQTVLNNLSDIRGPKMAGQPNTAQPRTGLQITAPSNPSRPRTVVPNPGHEGAAQATPNQPTPTEKPSGPSQVNEEKIRAFIEMTRLDRHMAIQMLERTNWDLQLAINILFND